LTLVVQPNGSGHKNWAQGKELTEAGAKAGAVEIYLYPCPVNLSVNERYRLVLVS